MSSSNSSSSSDSGHHGDAAVLNAILRSMDTPSNFTELSPAVSASTATERDHFFEIQHVIAAIREDPPLVDLNALYEIPVGFFLVLATFVNDRRNIYRIPRVANQAKKHISLADYAPARHDATIANYLSSRAHSAHGDVLVYDNLKALVLEFAVKEEKYARVAANVAVRLGLLMGWIDPADVNTGADN